MSREHEDWKRDMDAEREIRMLRDAIRRALNSEAFLFRAHVTDQLREIDAQLAEDEAHIVAVWD